MQKILRKRMFRDLKENLFRYLALGFLIMLGMYLIVSLVGAADTIMIGTEEKAKENGLEDGEFGVFVPLTEQEKEKLTKQGVHLEQMFYLDFMVKKKGTLRVFKNRETINLVNLDSGTLAKKKEEVVLEKRYCEEHKLVVGDNIEIASHLFRIVGIGSSPDYEAMYKNLSDSTVESSQFGLAFVTNEGYESLKESGKSEKSEAYQYAYRLNQQITEEELKRNLKDIKISKDNVEDIYFQDYWNESTGKKTELEKGMQELMDGLEHLDLSLTELCKYKDSLQEGAKEILNISIKEANTTFFEYGLTETLNETNFEAILGSLKRNSDNTIVYLKLDAVIEKLKKLKNYKDSIVKYTNSVKEIEEGNNTLLDGTKELQNGINEMLNTYFNMDISNLTFFLSASENPRIKAAADDQIINKMSGLIAGIIVMILFTYVISVFVIHSIEKESSIIGTLYALGAKKRDLMIHYLMLPVFITFVAGIIGTILGFSKWGISYEMQSCYRYFSLPDLQVKYSVYLILYGSIMPSMVAVIINCMVIQKCLSQPVLHLIRNEPKNNKVSHLNLGNMGFVGTFRIRQMLREARTSFTILFGMFISLLIMMLGMNCYVMCQHISIENKEDTKFEYMYTYKYPEKEVPEGGEACFSKTFKKEIYGYHLDVTLFGIDKKNPYFNAEIEEGKNQVVISSAIAQKYHLKEGEQLILFDEEEDMYHTFEISQITQYAAGLYAFMEIDSMRELFGVNHDYYNVVLSDNVLKIDAKRLYATTTKEEISRASDVFISQMMPMISVLCLVSVFMFCVVMYLMMKVMIERSAFHISLIQIFGYETKEIRKLYLSGNFYIVAIGAAICIPLAKLIMDRIYPILVSNVSCSMNVKFGWQLYIGIYLFVIVLYLLINQLLVRKLKKINPAEVLKNRE